ncbi:MAG: hypothetical protein GQ564_09315 [Bacteroidales bacterium]|nr:hypothetical protein [Bacteroidales bacterium]
MEKSIKNQLKIVIVAFIIIAFPMGYIVITSIKLDKANEAYEKAMIYDDKKIDLAIQEIDNALKFVFWKSNLTNQKAQLLYKKKEYRKILNCIKNTKAHLYKGLIYEHLNKSDSAKVFYKKEIPELKEQLREYKDDENLSLQIERQIALVYTFLGETDNARKYLKEFTNDYDINQKRMLQEYDFYIENYKSGGYKDFLEGETVLFGIDSFPSNIDIDSLFELNRFYYKGYTATNDVYEYKIKKIFEKKAISIGMNKIEKTKPNPDERSQ